jgi:hypothetical protein
MPVELPFEYQRAGSHNNIHLAPLANKGKLLPFIMPQSEARTIDNEYLVMVNSDGIELKRTPTDGFLQVSGTVIWNNQLNDLYQMLGSEQPCGYYYYLILAGGKSFKTEIFKIDNLIDKMGAPGTPQLPVVPQPLGDYNDDFNDDFYNG